MMSNWIFFSSMKRLTICGMEARRPGQEESLSMDQIGPHSTGGGEGVISETRKSANALPAYPEPSCPAKLSEEFTVRSV